ncbi:NFACT family protein [Candidatus Woesearchaeota archaeon]|nr:NFACT family protein [Candidatus Woesearchaeota archaeon]
MPFSLSSLDVHYLIRELRPLIQDAYVDKVYQDKEDFLIRMRSPKTGKQQLYIKVPDALFLTEHRFPWPRQPGGFCMQLRKHLTNAQLKGAEQHGFDRIVELVFLKGDKAWRLVIELFSKGNVVLVNEEGVIRGVMDLQRWKDRTLRVNAPYEYPPGKENPLDLTQGEFSSLFADAGKEVVKFCAATLGLGGKYAEELVSRLGFEKGRKDLDVRELSLLHEGFKELLEVEPSPVVEDGDAAPFPLKGWDGEAQPSFSAAVEQLVVAEKAGAIDASVAGVTASRKDKHQRIIDEQSLKLGGYRASAEENRRKGEFIYERYQELSSLFEELRSLHERGGWGAVEAYVKEKSLPVVVDAERGVVAVDVKE